jgi:enoyl-[acyl-carrier-protein] reductase (NADH)
MDVVADDDAILEEVAQTEKQVLREVGYRNYKQRARPINHPGVVLLTEGASGLGQEYIATMSAAIPLQRLGTVEEVGYAVAFLSSEEAGFITGQTLVMDGGQTLPESLQALES